MSRLLPEVSIIMAVRSPAIWLPEALASVASQEFDNWELNIVSDGPLDSSALNTGMLTERATLISLKPNSGPALCRNEALSRARAPLVAVLDADDVWESDHLGRQLEAFARDDHLVLRGTNAAMIDETGSRIGTTISPSRSLLPYRLLARNQFVHSSVVYRRQLALGVGGYPTQMRFAEDYALWLRLARFGRLANDRACTVRYRKHLHQTSSNPKLRYVDETLKQDRLSLGHQLHIPSLIVSAAHSQWIRRHG